jgi:ABC-type branched-subunit amino acid transport system substrate-binding protein
MTSFRTVLIGLLACSACTAFDHELPDCTTNTQCTAKLSAGGSAVQGVCVQPEAKCVALASDDCQTLTGNYMESPVTVPDDAVVIASLLSTTGAQGATNLARQQSAMMAVEEINKSGGIMQSKTPGDARKLVMLSCDENANLLRVTTHLFNELHIAGIVGPNLSQDTIDLTAGNNGLPSSAKAGTAMLSPSAVAAQIATIPSNGLSFMMVPSDSQRVPLMKLRINALESQLKTQRQHPIKLAIYYRNDALGQGTHDGLTNSSLTIDNLSLSDARNQLLFRDDVYDTKATAADNASLVQQYITFQPDIIVVIGTAEAVTAFTNPLEAKWQAQIPTMPKPYYVAIDSTKVPELLTAVGNATDDQRRRWSGTGVAPTTDSALAFNAFKTAFGERWTDSMGKPLPATVSGMGPAYDAVYSIALSLVGKLPSKQNVAVGATIAAGMQRLGSNPQACASDANGIVPPCYLLTDHTRTLTDSMTKLLDSKPVTEIGTFGALIWDAGAKSSGLIELWCIDGTAGAPVYKSASETYDLKSQTTAGTYTQCGP